MIFRSALLIHFLSCATVVKALSVEVSRARLQQAFASPSGKLTYSPELIIPEPNDPTAILLLSNAVQNLSSRIRACKANAAVLQGSVSALRTFVNEQEIARGNFPGPVPVIYAGSLEGMEEIAEAGAEGILVSICEGQEISSLSDLESEAKWQQICQQAIQCGIQPVPEITIGHVTASKWTEETMESLVDCLAKTIGADPAALIVTINPESDDEETPVAIPPVNKALNKRVPILGSVRVTAGEGRLNEESQRFKEAGFLGTFLRSDCVPGFRMNPNLEIVAGFWAHCIADLKSTKSKSFSFRAKNNMEKNALTNWANYQQNVIDSGALGDPNDSYSIVNEAAGEYKGFA
ncbi:hypothetical protein FisN_6Hh131 [Fistulifera solaris]|jgi:hypothetical protein|uniref:Fructose-bisphosphate aldolase n=1 Tax=Fistulifera solaris TaxID=1519565 RepID=A0A1Z5JNF0_FISSO|nr:hypothetical protein FisN_6Hh131 [Fistulifera solaris]|eukprot:GAX15514.1 hypothetical protein FisN_6Hh131 [Fistulifera solaris]